MDRRAAIVCLGAFLGGCTDLFASESTQQLESTKPPVANLRERCSSRTEKTASRTGSVRTPAVDIGVDRPSQNVHLDVELVQEFTEEHPAKIEVVLGNNAASERVFEYGPSPISHGRHVTQDAPIMAFWGQSGFSLEDGCWRYGEELIGIPILERTQLEPGETVSHKYFLIVPKGASACLPDGLYVFDSRVSVYPPGAEEDDESPEIRWALCLH